MWQEPVFDRTLLDVDEAKQQIELWSAQTAAGKIPEVTDLKGALNVSDLQRIEGNIEYLKQLMVQLAVPPKRDSLPKLWDKKEYFRESDAARIIADARNLCDGFYYPTDVEIPDGMLHYEQINALEKLLYRLHQMLTGLQLASKRSDVPICGESVSFPRKEQTKRYCSDYVYYTAGMNISGETVSLPRRG